MILTSALLLSACGDLSPGESFDIPASEAKEILLQTEAPYDVLGNSDLRSQVYEKSATTLVWTVMLGESEFMHFTAEVTPNSPTSTHVTVSLGGPAGGKYAGLEKALNDNLTVKNLYLAAMEEEVAAALEKRDFDIMKITPQLLAATGANLGGIMDRFDQVGQPGEGETLADKEQERQDREMAEWNSGESGADITQ